MANEAENITKVVEVLRKVPPKNLLLIELANRIPIKHGDLDIDVLSQMQKEVNLATAEAAGYGTYTINAVTSLIGLMGIERGPELEPLTEEDLEAGLQF